jgi:lysophospholipase L1-like esterase
MKPRRTVCVGDSITRGQVSVDYVELLRRRFHGQPYTFVNRGVNYDLAYNVRRRLDQVVADQPDVVTVLVGTNDANATLGESNRRLITWLKRPPTRPTPDWYQDNLAAIVTGLREHTAASIALLSLPVIGEDLDSSAIRRAGYYSAIVRDVALAHGAAYLPLYESQIAELRTRAQPPGTAYRAGLGLSSTASMQHFVLRRSLDAISARRGLWLTTDTVHQNSRGANLIADLVAEYLRSGTPSGEVPARVPLRITKM